MRIEIRTRADVRRLAAAVSLGALAAGGVLRLLFLPSEVAEALLLPGAAMTLMLAAPLAYGAGCWMLAMAERTARLERALEHDPLTGAFTRLSLAQRVAALGPVPSAVIVMDIDHFKRFNDSHGHPAGDLALRHVAALLVRNCRQDDIIARFGGEEFVIVLRGATLEAGRVAAGRLCRRLRAHPVMIGDRPLPVTASFGVAFLPPGGRLEETIEQADRALYRAKRTGRDRVCVDAAHGEPAATAAE